MTTLRLCLLVAAALGCAAPLTAADPFAFRDGDRVVLIGSTLIERAQKYGYWELALTLKNKDKNVTFRNLGWSGDTVFGESRNSFDPSPKGFQRLVSLTKELKPTVIVICYGHNESFAGPSGVAKFTAGLEKLIDALKDTKARVVLMSPTPFENREHRGEPAPQNTNLKLYVDAIKSVAEKRQLQYVGLFEKLISFTTMQPGLLDPTFTYNDLHLDAKGYAKIRHMLLASDAAMKHMRHEGIAEKDPAQREIREKLRATIVEKNRLFFYRWRPQNQTYLFGFRKHEQGQNAKEVAQFDPLVAAAEKEIAELKAKLK